MLAATAAAGIPCPEVLAVRTLRRAGLPFRSLLVLRALPVRPETAGDGERLVEEAVLATRLLAAGIVHPDLHGGNFVRLADGRLAVLDLQSARLRRAAAAAGSPRARIADRAAPGLGPPARRPRSGTGARGCGRGAASLRQGSHPAVSAGEHGVHPARDVRRHRASNARRTAARSLGHWQAHAAGVARPTRAVRARWQARAFLGLPAELVVARRWWGAVCSRSVQRRSDRGGSESGSGRSRPSLGPRDDCRCGGTWVAGADA
jgi:hypothetical protein